MKEKLNLSPKDTGDRYREIDQAIELHVQKRVTPGFSEDDVVKLRQEFEQALENINIELTPADQGSFLGVFDRALKRQLDAVAEQGNDPVIEVTPKSTWPRFGR